MVSNLLIYIMRSYGSYHPSAYISLKFHAYKFLVVLLKVLGWMYVLRVEGGVRRMWEGVILFSVVTV